MEEKALKDRHPWFQFHADDEDGNPCEDCLYWDTVFALNESMSAPMSA